MIEMFLKFISGQSDATAFLIVLLNMRLNVRLRPHFLPYFITFMNKYAAIHVVIAALLTAFCFGEQKRTASIEAVLLSRKQTLYSLINTSAAEA